MSTQETKIERLTALLGGRENSELVIGSVPLSALARQVATPFYVYSGDVVAGQVQRVLKALGPGVDLVFSVKANPSLGICQVIARQGIGCEVASIGELLLAQRAGFPAAKTLFIGPGKTDEELELAIDIGIKAIIVESIGELERVASIASRMRKVAEIGLRVNVASQVKGYQMRMGGGSQQFGIDEEELPDLLRRFGQDPRVRLVGLQVYAGSQMFDIEALLAHCHHIVDLGLALAEHLGRPLEMLDFGGGFGVPYFESSEEFDLGGFAAGFQKVVDRCKADPRLASAQPVIELGRYLVAEAGVYVTRVLDVKTSRGKTFVVTDGGMNHHLAATGNFGQVFRKPYPLALLNRMGATTQDPVAVVGPNCTPLDVFGQNITLPKAEVGDLVGVFYSGAYGYSVGSLGFLSHPTPAEVMIWQGETYLLRDPGRADQVLDGQRGLEDDGAAILETGAATRLEALRVPR